MIITVQVENAAAAYAQLKAGGAPIAHPLQDEPWGQKRFIVCEPSGICLDVVEQIEPAPGYWDRYLLRHDVYRSADYLEGLTAFREKRKPVFTGE